MNVHLFTPNTNRMAITHLPSYNDTIHGEILMDASKLSFELKFRSDDTFRHSNIHFDCDCTNDRLYCKIWHPEKFLLGISIKVLDINSIGPEVMLSSIYRIMCNERPLRAYMQNPQNEIKIPKGNSCAYKCKQSPVFNAHTFSFVHMCARFSSLTFKREFCSFSLINS